MDFEKGNRNLKFIFEHTVQSSNLHIIVTRTVKLKHLSLNVSAS